MTLSIQKSSLPGGTYTDFDGDVIGLLTHQCPKVLVDNKEMYLVFRDKDTMSFVTLNEDHLYICEEASIQGIETEHLDVVFLNIIESRKWS